MEVDQSTLINNILSWVITGGIGGMFIWWMRRLIVKDEKSRERQFQIIADQFEKIDRQFKEQEQRAKEQFEQFNKVFDKEFTQLRADYIETKSLIKENGLVMDTVRQSMHTLEVDIKDNYLKTTRFEKHENKMEGTITRVYQRMEEIQKLRALKVGTS